MVENRRGGLKLRKKIMISVGYGKPVLCEVCE